MFRGISNNHFPSLSFAIIGLLIGPHSYNLYYRFECIIGWCGGIYHYIKFPLWWLINPDNLSGHRVIGQGKGRFLIQSHTWGNCTTNNYSKLCIVKAFVFQLVYTWTWRFSLSFFLRKKSMLNEIAWFFTFILGRWFVCKYSQEVLVPREFWENGNWLLKREREQIYLRIWSNVKIYFRGFILTKVVWIISREAKI